MFTWIAVTVPPIAASISFSIFMASRTATFCPCFTASPTLTDISTITPGSGAGTGLPLPDAGAGAAASVAGAGAGAGVGAGATGCAAWTGAGWGAGACDIAAAADEHAATPDSTEYCIPLTVTTALSPFMELISTLYSLPFIVNLYWLMVSCFYGSVYFLSGSCLRVECLSAHALNVGLIVSTKLS